MTKVSQALYAFVLLVISIQSIGAAFIYDFPQIFEAILIQRMSITASQIQFLYSLGNLPNLVSGLFASFFVSKVGVGLIVVIFQLFAFMGASLTYLAVRMNSYYFLCFGRIFVGISFDLCILGVLVSCEKWFRGKFLSISLGLARFLRMISTSSSFFFLPKIYLATRNLENCAFCCIIVTFTVFLTTSVFSVLDIKYGDLVHEAKTNDQKQKAPLDEGKKETENQDLLASQEASVVSINKTKNFTLRHLRYVPLKAWIIFTYGVFVPNLYYLFTDTGSDFLVIRYSLSYETAKNTLSLLPLLAAFCLPVTSTIYTKFGFKPIGQFLATLAGLAGYSYLAFIPSSGSGSLTIIALAILALYYGLCFGCLFSNLFLCIPSEATSLVSGLFLTFQNSFYCTLPFICSFFYESRTAQGYQNWLYFMMGFAIISSLFALLALVVDLKGDKILMMPENNPKVAEIQRYLSDRFKNSVLKQKGDSGSQGPKTEYATLAAPNSKTWKSSARSGVGSSQGEIGQIFDGYEFNQTRANDAKDIAELRSKTDKISKKVAA